MMTYSVKFVSEGASCKDAAENEPLSRIGPGEARVVDG